MSSWKIFQDYLVQQLRTARNHLLSSDSSYRSETQPGSNVDLQNIAVHPITSPPDAVPMLQSCFRTQFSVELEDSWRCNSTMHALPWQDSSESAIFMLPCEVLLKILSYLPVRDLCNCAAVCRTWYAVGSDSVLWQARLDEDMASWILVTHETCPDLLQGTASPKQVYLRACPFMKRNYTRTSVYSVQRLLSFLLPFFSRGRTPRFIMMGAGLESRRTGKIVGKMVHNRCVEFEPVGMFTGTGGFGSGLNYILRCDGNAYHFDLITLYSNQRDRREYADNQLERLMRSHILVPPSAAALTHEEQTQWSLTESVASLCSQVDGLVYVLDAEDCAAEQTVLRHELRAVLAALPAIAPLLLPSLIGNEAAHRRVSAVQLARELQLLALDRPWCVRNGVTKSLAGVSQAFLWLIETCSKNHSR